MSDQFTLTLQVTGLKDLDKFNGLLESMAKAGSLAEGSLAEAQKQTKAVQSGFSALSKQFKASFGELEKSVQNLTTGLEHVQKASKATGGKSQSSKIADDAKAATAALEAQKAAALAAAGASGAGASAPIDSDALAFASKQRGLMTGTMQARLREAAAVARAETSESLKTTAFQRGLMTGTMLHRVRTAAAAARAETAESERSTAVQRGFQTRSMQARLREVAAVASAEKAAAAKALEALGAQRSMQTRTMLQRVRERTAAAQTEVAQDLKSSSFRAGLQVGTMRQSLKAAADAEKAAAAESEAITRGRFSMMGRMAQQAAREQIAASKLANAAFARDAEFQTQTTLQQLARVERARRRIALGSTDEPDLRRRFGNEALRTARDDTAYQELLRAAQVAALEREERARTSRRRAPVVAPGGGGGGGPPVAPPSGGGPFGGPPKLPPKKDLEDHINGVLRATNAYNGLHTGLRGAAGAMGAIWLTWGKPLLALWTGFAIAAGMKAAIVQSAEFSHQLTIMGALAEASTKEIQNLSDSALQLAKTGIYGPIKIAEGLKVLTLAGLKAKEALEVLPTVLDFATIGELDIDTAAKSLVGIASAFNKGNTAGAFSEVSDKISKGAAISQTSIENMTSAIKVSSVVAEQFGASLTDVSAILSQLAKRNIDATSAGTALRNAYNEVYAPTEKAKKALQSLGISAYDAKTKQMKPFIDVMAELAKAVQSFDKQSQIAIFDTIFGERGSKVASALLSDLGAIRKAQLDIGNAAGFAMRAAVDMEDSLKNRAAAAVSALQAAVVEAGLQAEKPIRELLAQFTNLVKSKEFVEGLRDIAIIFSQLARVVVENGPIIASMFAAVMGVKVLGWVAGLAKALSGLVSAARPVFAALTGLGGAAAEAAVGVGAVAGAKATLGTQLVTLGTGILRFIPQFALLSGAIYLGVEAWKAYKKAKGEAINEDGTVNNGAMTLEQKNAELLRKSDEARYAAMFKNRSRTTTDVSTTSSFQEEIDKLKKGKADDLSALRNKAAADTMGLAPSDEAIKAAEKKWNRAIRAAEDRRDQFLENNKIAQREAGATQYGKSAGLELATGDKKFEAADLKGSNSYQSALATKLAAERDQAAARFEAARKGFDLEAQYQESFRRNGIKTDEEYTVAIQDIAKRRAKALVDEAQFALDLLPRQKQERIAEINDKSKDPKERSKQIAAADAEFSALTTRAEQRVREAQAAATFIDENALFELQAFLRKRAEDDLKSKNEIINALNEGAESNRIDLEALVEQVGGKEELNRLKQSLSGATDLEISYLERRVSINRAFERRIAAIRKNPNSALTDEADAQAARDEALANAAETARLESEGRTNPLRGIQASARRMGAEVSNIADSMGKAFENAFKGAEDVFVKFVTTGKGSFKDLATSILSDLARIAFQQTVTAPLANALTRALGVAPAAAVPGIGAGDLLSTAFVAHSGGMVGALSTQRKADPALFSGARRYHGGGLVADEVPIIARKGERVLTPEQNRSYEKGGDGVNINQTINVQGGANKADVMNAMVAAKRSAKAEIQDAQRRGRRRY